MTTGYIEKDSSRKRIEYVIDDNGCYICTSHKQRNKIGYFSINRNYKTQLLHRYIYSLYSGEIPNGFVVRHKCDNINCINPKHLELGTQQDNMRDMLERGRRARGGTLNKSSIKEKDIPLIRADIRPNTVIAKEYGVTKAAIRQIKQRITWSHIE
jgi:hypothetical protein